MSNHALSAAGFLGSEFNEFLFESICVDQAGSPLTVVSALARLDLDAWAEAGKLARLPRDIAVKKLSLSLTKLTECPQAVRDAHKIAERLVELLPTRSLLAGQGTERPQRFGTARQWGHPVIICIVIMALLIGVQMLVSPAPIAAHSTTTGEPTPMPQ